MPARSTRAAAAPGRGGGAAVRATSGPAALRPVAPLENVPRAITPPPAPAAPSRAIVPTGAPPRILPLSEVRPGMVGEALTVFQGRKPEPFKVRVISILRNFLPKQDVILIRAEDPRLEHSGIVAGMSGSPVYVGGRLMGAVAYGWSFAKEPLGGVTPIEAMLAERTRPRRAATTGDAKPTTDGIRTLTLAEGGPDSWSDGDSRAAPPPPWEPAVPRATVAAAETPATSRGALDAGAQLRPVAIPLAVAGFDARTTSEMERLLSPFGLVPMRGGGGRRPGDATGPGHVEPGSAIGVELVRGDMSMVGTGTVSYVDGDTVLAFGHPLMGAGELYLPLVDAEIHAILPSLAQSMKLSSPIAEVGALIQDRKACILGDLGARVPMVPVTVRLTAPGAPPRSFHAEVAHNRRLTPALVALVASSAIADAEPDPAEMVVNVTSTVKLRGQAPVTLRDQIFSTDGISSTVLSGVRGLRAIGDLLGNPFQPVSLERVDLDVRLEFRRHTVEIVGASLPGGVVRPGDAVPLAVSLRPYDGPEYTQTVPFAIPSSAAGQTVKIEIVAGTGAKPDVAPPESLPAYLDYLTKYYPASSIVVSVQTPDDGAATRGRLLPDLPSAALDTLRSGGRTRRTDLYHVADRTVFPTDRIIYGRQELTVYVESEGLDRPRPPAL
jgi:SpoIVB peptidase S55